MIKTILAVLFVAFSFTLPTQAQERVELGKLECFVDEGVGFLIGSSKDISCIFTSIDGDGEPDNYFGVINKLGLDIGKTEQSYISWLVIAPNFSDFKRGFLQGDYIGASASATIAVGLGANALVGGSGQTFALQPLSIQTQEGLNLAVGVAEIELRAITD